MWARICTCRLRIQLFVKNYTKQIDKKISSVIILLGNEIYGYKAKRGFVPIKIM